MGIINLSCKEIFQDLIREISYEIIEVTNETKFDDLMYYFNGDTAIK